MVRHFPMWSLVVAWILSLATMVSGQTTLALYDAGLAGGGPADLDPTLQSWTPIEVDSSGGPLTNVFPLQPDGATGFNAWQINDQQGTGNPSPNDNPAYTSALSAQTLQDMFDFGWEFQFRFRPVQGGNFIAWGAAAGSPFTPGAAERVGFGLNIDTMTNAAVVSPEGGTPINLGDNSADSYHEVRAVGTPASTSYDVFVDDVFQQTLDVSAGTTNSGFFDVVRWESGSSGGVGRVVNFNYVELTRGDTPGSMELVVARETGQMTMSNNTGDSLTILGYSVLSDGGALQPSEWLSIAEYYDAGNSGPDQVDPNNNWTVLTNPNSRTDLSEAELEGGDGATIANGQSIDLGTPGYGNSTKTWFWNCSWTTAV